MNTKQGVKRWNRAKKIIPGGSQLLSKRSEQFLPDQWPSYYKKAKGVYIWDYDGNKFTDMAYMGIGACTLGYADDDVNRAVKKAIDLGTATTLNCFEEVELAELLLKINPWAQMARFARTGGESVAVAVRIARAYSKRDKVAFCGYHGWHDWHIAANLADDKNLDGHLIPGLKPLGVPRALKGTAIPFKYNKIEELERIVDENKGEIGAIVMEPIRHHSPKNGFLEKVRKIASSIDAPLVFDEVSSAWRMNAGGAHELFGVRPDIAVYGKAMGNGYPIGAIVGKESVMNSAQDSFISSTNWTERIGPVAAITTIKKMQKVKAQAHMCMIGDAITRGWEKLADEHELKLEVLGAVPPLTTLEFKYGDESQAIRTLFTQEMLKRGILAASSVYTSYKHTKENVNDYLENVSDVFGIIKKAVDKGNVHELLRGPVAHSGFKRLT